MASMGLPTGAFSSGGVGGGNKVPKGYQSGQLQQFTPEQMQLFQSLFGHLGQGSFLSRLAGGEEGTFDQLETPALKQFHGLQGQLASRFSGQGMGGRRSSGFQNAATSASSDFAQQLQAQRLGLQRQALGDLFGMSNTLLSQRPYEQYLTEEQPSWWETLLGGLGGLGGELGGFAGKLGLGKKFGLF